MTKVVYCSKCGKRLLIYRKALPAYGTIIELIEPHKCGTKVEDFDLSPLPYHPNVDELSKDENNKFVRKLNNLPKHKLPISDRRAKENLRQSKQSTSMAPAALLSQIKSDILPTQPEGDLMEDFNNETSEMEG